MDRGSPPSSASETAREKLWVHDLYAAIPLNLSFIRPARRRHSSMAVPRIGVGVFVFAARTSNHYLLGKRLGSHGAGTFALPGGHLEYGESFEQCATREVEEETGLAITDVRFLTATNSVFHETTKHYVTIFMTAVARSADDGLEPEPKVMEPDKCEGWSWSTFSDMRKMTAATGAELFKPLYSLLEQRTELCKLLESVSGPPGLFPAAQ
ncbi:hypothetical protein KC367_g2785 [Hortaea werneckii]|nr:hypothetical protein KC367_g2785 [Hortaea werneckii]